MSKSVLNRDELPAGSSIRRVSEKAAELGLDIEIVKMADSTRTAEDAAAACECQVGQIVKSLVFENSDTGAITLLLVSGAHNADLDHVASAHGLKLGRCDGRRVTRPASPLAALHRSATRSRCLSTWMRLCCTTMSSGPQPDGLTAFSRSIRRRWRRPRAPR